MLHTKKIILTGPQAREKLLAGALFASDAVKITLGIHGANFVDAQAGGTPKITNDGVSILRQLNCDDEIEDAGLRTIREAALKVNDKVGDGTTTATVVAATIFESATRYLPGSKNVAGKLSPMQVRNQIAKETAAALEALKGMATPILTKEELIASALVSVEDQGLADMIGSMQWELGPEGTIIVEATADDKDQIEKVNGIRIDNGFGASFAINNKEKQSLEYKDCHVILTDAVIERLDNHKDNRLLGIMTELVKAKSKALIIVGRGFTDKALQDCAQSAQADFPIFPINAPYVNQAQVMLDMAASLGGRFMKTETTDLRDMTLSDVGFADQIRAYRFTAVFTGKETDESRERIVARVKDLEAEAGGEVSEFAKREIQGRISQLTNGFAVLKIGTTSEADHNYRKDKVEDCVNAVKAAYQEGTVPGAGLALKTIGDAMPDDSIIKRALLAPHKEIMANAGGDFEIPDWVRDPLKVVRIGLEMASSVAAALATAGGAINTAREKPRYVEEVKKD